MAEPLTIAVDASGGYGAPAAMVEAVGELSRRRSDQVYYVLVGHEERIDELLVRTRHNPERISVVASADAIGTAASLVGSGEAHALVSAGPAGAIVRAARRAFPMLPGVERAALATVYPTWDSQGGEHFCLMLDVGASLRASADDLTRFAAMGVAYARIVTGRERPTVGLLSVSPDPAEGPPEVVEAARRLAEDDSLEFVGPVEGHQILRGGIDVIVCEGFAGDLAIKVIEGFADAAFELAENAYQRKLAYRMGLRLLSPGLRKIRRAVHFETYGGAPLLGFEKVVIVCDPRSSPRAIANGIKLAAKNVRAELPARIAATA